MADDAGVARDEPGRRSFGHAELLSELDSHDLAAAVAFVAATNQQSVPAERDDALQSAFTDQEFVEMTETAALFQGIDLFTDVLDVDLDG